MSEVSVYYLELSLNLLLVVRLFSLQIGRVYSLFAAFLITDLVGALLAGFDQFHIVDYRISYSAVRVFAWIFSVWMIYALLDSMLKKLPGILRYSKRLLNFVFAAAFVLGIVVIASDSAISKVEDWRRPLDRVVATTFVVDEVIGITVFLVLILMLGFFLWFPISAPRNLAVFSIGYVVYFSSVAGLLFFHGLEARGSSRAGSVICMLITCVCYVYWTVFLSKAGEMTPVRIGHSWKVDEQQRLIRRLEEVNGVLLQAVAKK